MSSFPSWATWLTNKGSKFQTWLLLVRHYIHSNMKRTARGVSPERWLFTRVCLFQVRALRSSRIQRWFSCCLFLSSGRRFSSSCSSPWDSTVRYKHVHNLCFVCVTAFQHDCSLTCSLVAWRTSRQQSATFSRKFARRRHFSRWECALSSSCWDYQCALGFVRLF